MTTENLAIEHLDDIGFTVAWQLDSDHRCDFTAYEIICPYIEGQQERSWHAKGYTSSSDCVESIDLAQPFVHGYVRWDGCSNWHFDEQDSIMLHFCSKDEAGNIGRLLERLYEIAAKAIPAWDGLEDGT